jgi:predicted GNAT family acetyltransferase
MNENNAEVRDNPEESRFEMATGGGLAISEYRMRDGVLHILHTEVPEKLRGQGVGARLARGVLDAARARGVKVVPRCPFVAAFMKRHKEYDDLRA